jgi:fatty-acid desaturase
LLEYQHKEVKMIAIGVILLILGLIFGVPILTYIGVVAIVVGAVFWLLGAAGHAVGGRRVWY